MVFLEYLSLSVRSSRPSKPPSIFIIWLVELVSNAILHRHNHIYCVSLLCEGEFRAISGWNYLWFCGDCHLISLDSWIRLGLRFVSDWIIFLAAIDCNVTPQRICMRKIKRSQSRALACAYKDFMLWNVWECTGDVSELMGQLWHAMNPMFNIACHRTRCLMFAAYVFLKYLIYRKYGFCYDVVLQMFAWNCFGGFLGLQTVCVISWNTHVDDMWIIIRIFHAMIDF